MTTQEVRNYVDKSFGDSSSFYKLLTRDNLELLKKYIRTYYQKLLYEFDGKPEFRVKRKIEIKYTKEGAIECAFMYVKGRHFEERELVSFNRDGFIGFAGWASTTNVEPIINGFMDWLNKEIMGEE